MSSSQTDEFDDEDIRKYINETEAKDEDETRSDSDLSSDSSSSFSGLHKPKLEQ